MRRQSGFTLIEILVVLAIISAILGGISLMIQQAGRSKMRLAAVTRVNNLGAALEQAHAPEKLGMYPPSRLDMLVGPGSMGPVGKKLGSPNDVNCGIETVYVALRLKGINLGSVPGFDEDGALANLDGDRAAEMVPDLQSPDLFEYLDPWGNPIVYISSRDYKDPKKVERYVLADGKEIKVAPARKANGEFQRGDSFQLFSLGPDAQPGTDDDIHYGQQ
jgi:prepilin-type N-terminal cleavage/methylation domain-containing protein